MYEYVICGFSSSLCCVLLDFNNLQRHSSKNQQYRQHNYFNDIQNKKTNSATISSKEFRFLQTLNNSLKQCIKPEFINEVKWIVDTGAEINFRMNFNC